jgi:ABC-2 type transport system ATP-binding protein
MHEERIPVVSLEGVSILYGDRRALDSVHVQMEAGAVTGLLGPNGSGKSSLLMCAAGLVQPSEGRVQLLGGPLKAATRARVGVVFQPRCLDPLMTVRETIDLQGNLYGMSRQRIDEQGGSLLREFGLLERAKDAVGTLSGGLGRRLELARALLTEPELLILDEPTTGLDPDSKRAFWEVLRTSHGERSVLLATNDVLEAERECDTVHFLKDGHVIASGAPADLKRGLRQDSIRVECRNGQAASLSQTVSAWPGVGGVTKSGQSFHVTVDDASSFVPRLFEAGGPGIHSISIEESTLEDAYFQLAGTPLVETPA